MEPMKYVCPLAIALCCGVSAATPGPESVPLFFVPNRGQAPSGVQFMVKGSGVTAHLKAQEIELRVAGHTVALRFEGPNPGRRIEGGQRLPGYANFFTGSSEEWRTDVPLYGAVVYRELYPGIDLRYASAGRNLKSEFVVAPGVDPTRIRMRYAGADP